MKDRLARYGLGARFLARRLLPDDRDRGVRLRREHRHELDRLDRRAGIALPVVSVRGRPPKSNLVVAVTGPTGTFGFGLVPLLQADPRIAHVIGIARRPFDPSITAGTRWSTGGATSASGRPARVPGADVVVHLAFLIAGTASRATLRATKLEGTLNAVRAAAAAGTTRLVFASSVAAHGSTPTARSV